MNVQEKVLVVEYLHHLQTVLVPNVREKFVNLELVHNPSVADVNLICAGLKIFNVHHLPELNERDLAIFIKAENAEIVGGLVALTVCSIMQIKYLWIDERYRMQGLGSKLLLQIIEYAKSLNISSITLETYSFQAPAFYLAHGFVEVGKYTDYPAVGINKLFYQKAL